jgi:hypothetical protein
LLTSLYHASEFEPWKQLGAQRSARRQADIFDAARA